MRNLLIFFLSVFVLYSCNKDEALTETTENVTQGIEKDGQYPPIEELAHSKEFKGLFDTYLNLTNIFLAQSLKEDVPLSKLNSNINTASNAEIKYDVIREFFASSYEEEELIYQFDLLYSSVRAFINKYPDFENKTAVEIDDIFARSLELNNDTFIARIKDGLEVNARCNPLNAFRNSEEWVDYFGNELSAMVYFCPNWVFECEEDFEFCVSDAYRDLYNQILYTCLATAVPGSFSLTAYLSTPLNGVAPGISIVIGGTAAILTGAICIDEARDYFRDVQCPKCMEDYVNDCCSD